MNILDCLSFLEPELYAEYGWIYTVDQFMPYCYNNQDLVNTKLLELQAAGKGKIIYVNDVPFAFKAS